MLRYFEAIISWFGRLAEPFSCTNFKSKIRNAEPTTPRIGLNKADPVRHWHDRAATHGMRRCASTCRARMAKLRWNVRSADWSILIVEHQCAFPNESQLCSKVQGNNCTTNYRTTFNLWRERHLQGHRFHVENSPRSPLSWSWGSTAKLRVQLGVVLDIQWIGCTSYPRKEPFYNFTCIYLIYIYYIQDYKIFKITTHFSTLILVDKIETIELQPLPGETSKGLAFCDWRGGKKSAFWASAF